MKRPGQIIVCAVCLTDTDTRLRRDGGRWLGFCDAHVQDVFDLAATPRPVTLRGRLMALLAR